MTQSAAVLFNGPGTIEEAAVLVASVLERHLDRGIDGGNVYYAGSAFDVSISVMHNAFDGGDRRIFSRRWQIVFADNGAPDRGYARLARQSYDRLSHTHLGVTLMIDGEVREAQSPSGTFRLAV